MILDTLLHRLRASLADGPGLNARPHHSRQRVDLSDLAAASGTTTTRILDTLLDPRRGAIELSPRVASFERPTRPEREWTASERVARDTAERQGRLVDKLRDLATDAGDYVNDHGESALFIGFPLLSLPPVTDRTGQPGRRILAPVAFVPVILRVRRGNGITVVLEASGTGADRLVPNPSLLAWLEQETGRPLEDLPPDEAGDDPWRELRAILDQVAKAAGIDPVPAFDSAAGLQPVPRTDDLPATACVLPGAVLGLFPTTNPGLLRDMRWMHENPGLLAEPVTTFLNPAAATQAPTSPDTSVAGQFSIVPADPCQSAAVAHARLASTLVIHGPPGTGKSQTIANIIGDHLARGERVLFVCDKRTALDVVQFRLEALGLGGLCGVVHDPRADRRDLYLQLRSVLDGLAEAPPLPDPAAELERTNLRIAALHAELSSAFRQLHATPGVRSFHDLCGDWLALHDPAVPDLPDIEGLLPDLLQGVDADCEEIVRRAWRSGWPTNPYRGRLALTPERWLAREPQAWRAFLDAGIELARQLDALPGANSTSPLPPLTPDQPWTAQAARRREIASCLEKIDLRGDPEVAGRFSDGTDAGEWVRRAADLEPSAASALDTPSDRELWPQVRDSVPGLAEIRRHKRALQDWAEVASSWRRMLSFGRRAAAKPILTRLALPMDADATRRAIAFVESIEERWQWSELRSELLGQATPVLAPDAALRTLRDGLPELAALGKAMAGGPAESATIGDGLLRAQVLAALRTPPDRAPLIRALRDSAALADLLAKVEEHWDGFLTPDAWREWAAKVCVREPALPFATALRDAEPTLEDAVRIHSRVAGLPPPLRTALDGITLRPLPWETGRPALHRAALAHAMRHRLATSPDLARIDSARVDAALAELGRLGGDKAGLVRSLVLHRWQRRWRDRLLAGTGTRLNSLGASLRQRLFVRGQRALKLRQMVATGAGIEGGDPLFDLCPVWMASPAAVAQVFPREAVFDIVVFDEASQCRLEEALPVLLRARRVVIAGDPRQLPPTRFFEAGQTGDEDADAETVEQVFHMQQAGAEDLLTAALNLAVQEAFLDVHYRSRDASLIGFSNQAFYDGRLVPLPGHPQRRPEQSAIRFRHVGGTYAARGNPAEAAAAVEIVDHLLSLPSPPSIGIACFNLPQRDLILDALDDRAAADPAFAERLAVARTRQGAGSFEGLFVKNLENVQGDERDHLIVCTTFGPDETGRFRRNFGALSRVGGERRLNVLVTRAREAVHVLTSIPRGEYAVEPDAASGDRPTGRHFLYAYLRYAEPVSGAVTTGPAPAPDPAARCEIRTVPHPSPVATALGPIVAARTGGDTVVHWGNDGFCIDVVAHRPDRPDAPWVGLLTDFNRYPRTPDPIAWEQFRTQVLQSQGWELERVWSPALFRAGGGHPLA